MTNFLVGQKNIAGSGGVVSEPILFTSKASRAQAKGKEREKKEERHRTSSAAPLVNTRRFSSFTGSINNLSSSKNDKPVDCSDDDSDGAMSPTGNVKAYEKPGGSVFDPLLSPKFQQFTDNNKTMELNEVRMGAFSELF